MHTPNSEIDWNSVNCLRDKTCVKMNSPLCTHFIHKRLTYCYYNWLINMKILVTDLSVSMASALDCARSEIPFTFRSWSLVRRRPSLEAAPPCRTLFTKIPRSTDDEPGLPLLWFMLWLADVLPLTLTPATL